MADQTQPRPQLADDSAYLKGVKDTIAARPEIEPIDFERLTSVLQCLGVNENIYEFITAESLDNQRSEGLISRSFEAIQSGELDGATRELIVGLWDYLAEADETSPADLVLTFGGPGTAKVDKAVELYKQGIAPKMLFTGKHASYIPNADQTEAEYDKQLALRAGVPETDILVESDSRNTAENAANAVKLLHKLGEQPLTIIAVALPYHMRRTWMTLRGAADWNPRVLRCPIASAKFTRDNFYLDQNGWSYVVNEYLKLYMARLMRHF